MTHKHCARMLVAGALLSTVSIPVHSAIFDRDDREYVSVAQDSPYSPIGIVVSFNVMKVHPFRSSTGFLVDNCNVLTTQSVLAYNYKKKPVGRRLKFQTGIGTLHPQTTKGTVVAVGGGERLQTSEKQAEVGGRDWLLLRLDRCVGESLGHVTLETGPFSLSEFRNLRSVGFPRRRGKKNGATMDPSCNVIGSRGTVWLNDCALIGGEAGDPIFRLAASGSKPHMVVYAMQSVGYVRGEQPIHLIDWYENQAVPMSLVAPQIAPFLSPRSSDKLASQIDSNSALGSECRERLPGR